MAPAATRCWRACSASSVRTGWCAATPSPTCAPHKGNVTDHVIEGAYEVLHGFERVQDSRDAMRVITLDDGEAEVFARSALTLKYDDSGKALPITETQILRPRRFDDNLADLWSVFNRVQENLVKAAWPAVPPTGASNARAPFKASTRMSGSTGHSGCSRMACVSSKPDPQADRAHRGMVRFSLVSLQQTGGTARRILAAVSQPPWSRLRPCPSALPTTCPGSPDLRGYGALRRTV